MGVAPNLDTGRVAWVDYAKGFCIIFVVMMHSTLGVEAAAGQQGFMHYVVAFAKPFRMPDFFLISGLFLARVIDRDWKTYLDRKVVHFAYFYTLWVTIQFAVKGPEFAAEYGLFGVLGQYLLAFVQPFGTLWFIYMLPIFFIVTKLARDVPSIVIWLCAAALEIAHVHTGLMIIDEFASRFVYFYTGYLLAPHVFALAAGVQTRPLFGLFGLLVWGIVNHFFIVQSWADLPFLSLGLGLAGAWAVVSASALMAKSNIFAPLRYCGQHSIVIYLAFFLPMAASRIFLLKTGLIADVGTISVLVTAAGVVGSVVLFWLVRGTPLRFLFERSRMFWLVPKPGLRLQPAE